MAGYWTLDDGTTEQTFAEWGISNVALQIQNQSPDFCTFDADGVAFDGTESFTYGSTLTIRKGRTKPVDSWTGGEVFFVGRVIEVPRAGQAESESIGYKLAGPWWYLDNLIFEQTWKSWNNSTEEYDTLSTSHVFLGTTQQNGTIHNSGAQITEIVQHAITNGAPMQLGTGFPAQNFPIAEVKDTTCAECVRLVLRWHPDAATWFDYSTSPPTFNCKLRSALSAVSVPIGEPPLASVELVKRSDLQVPYVNLRFERMDTIDDTPRLVVETQTAGNTAIKFGGLVSTINLLGYSINHTSALVVNRSIDPTSTTWWKYRYPWLGDTRVSGLVIEAGSTEMRRSDGVLLDIADWPTELVSGQVAHWMEHGSTALSTVKATVKATAKVTHTGSVGVDDEHESVEVLTANIVALNVGSLGTNGRTFSTLASYEEGDTAPTGLAQSLFNALSVVHYEGSIVLVEEDCGDYLRSSVAGTLGIGCVINLTGGHADWSTGNAMVQSVTMVLDSGTTTMQVGPPSHLGPQDLAQLTLINRRRWRYTAPAIRTSGELLDGGHGIELGSEVAETDSTSGLKQDAKTVVRQVSGRYFQVNTTSEADQFDSAVNNCRWSLGKGTKRIECMINTDDDGIFTIGNLITISEAQANDKEIQLREINICVDDGEGGFEEKRMIVLASEAYDPPS